MGKGVGNLPRYREVALAANTRYLQALAAVDDPAEALDQLASLTQRVRKEDTTHRPLNPLSPHDLALFKAVMRGEYALKGFLNRDIRLQLHGHHKDPNIRGRHRASVSRLLRLLQAHHLIAKIPNCRRWRVTQTGQKLMGAAIHLGQKEFPEAYNKAAA
jgi:hypothetical protein